MAGTVGKDGLLKTGSNAVAELLSWSLNEDINMVEDTKQEDTTRTFATGISSWSGRAACHWDPTDTNGQEALTVGASITLNLYPNDDQSGDAEYTGTALITGVETALPDPGSDTIKRNFTFQGTGALTKGTV